MLFERTWCADSQLTDEDLLSGFVIAGASAGMFPKVLNRVCKRRSVERLERILERERLVSEPRSDRAFRSLLERLLVSWKEEKERDTREMTA